MSHCTFCKIAKGEVPAQVVFANDELIAFEDISPAAPVHLLIIPKRHIATLNDLSPADAQVVGNMFLCAKNLARERNVSEAGYRTVMNCMSGAGQSVYHIHLHVLGGRAFHWPPG